MKKVKKTNLNTREGTVLGINYGSLNLMIVPENQLMARLNDPWYSKILMCSISNDGSVYCSEELDENSLEIIYA